VRRRTSPSRRRGRSTTTAIRSTIVRYARPWQRLDALLPSKQMETPAEQFHRLTGTLKTAPNTPQRRRCSGIKKNGERCGAWSVTGMDKCAGHLKLVPLDSAVGVEGRRKAAEKRRQARLSVRERAALALDDDWPDVLAALRRGLKDQTRLRQAAQRWLTFNSSTVGSSGRRRTNSPPAAIRSTSLR
jgi:hypothetical protein